MFDFYKKAIHKYGRFIIIITSTLATGPFILNFVIACRVHSGKIGFSVRVHCVDAYNLNLSPLSVKDDHANTLLTSTLIAISTT